MLLVTTGREGEEKERKETKFKRQERQSEEERKWRECENKRRDELKLMERPHRCCC